MIKDTCLGCPVAAGPLLQRFALGSSRKLHPARSLHKQQLNIQQKCNENKYGEQYKNIQYHAWMHRIFMMINMARQQTNTNLRAQDLTILGNMILILQSFWSMPDLD
jgi:hypothetical protein